jgi:hypothetical protein
MNYISEQEYVNMINNSRSLITMKLCANSVTNITRLPIFQTQLLEIFNILDMSTDNANICIAIISNIHRTSIFPRSEHYKWINKLEEYIDSWNEKAYQSNITYTTIMNQKKIELIQMRITI